MLEYDRNPHWKPRENWLEVSCHDFHAFPDGQKETGTKGTTRGYGAGSALIFHAV